MTDCFNCFVFTSYSYNRYSNLCFKKNIIIIFVKTFLNLLVLGYDNIFSIHFFERVEIV